MRLKRGKSTPRSSGEYARARFYLRSHTDICALGQQPGDAAPASLGPLGSLHPGIHVNILAQSRAQKKRAERTNRDTTVVIRWWGPGCRALPDAQSGHRRVRAAWTRGAGGLEAFVCRSAGRGRGGIRGGVRARVRRGRRRLRPARPGPGAGAGRRRLGCGLTSPGTAPSTPSRYSGTARAAAGRCWRRG